MQVSFHMNGIERSLEVEPLRPAAAYLSDAYKRRARCSDGRCLQCLLLLGGRVVPACSLPAYRLDGATIHDVEGLGHDELYQAIMRAFDKIGLSRCGGTLPGLVLLAYQLLTTNAVPPDDELQETRRHIRSRCVSRDEWERATRLAGRVWSRKRSSADGT